MKKIAIILVNYQDYAKRFLAECRDSLRAQNYPKELFRVYIIDNASSEESFNYLKNVYPEAHIIARADGNYAAANNTGIEQGTEDGCEYFVIANMDTKFDADWLGELVLAAENNPLAGIVQSKILLYPKTEEEWKRPKINTLGNSVHYLGFGMTTHYGEEDKEGGEEYPEIKGYASGCSLLVKKEVLDKINGYNEEYYMYHDDLEMGWKARLFGYKIILAPKSIVYHKYEFERSVRMLYYMERNRYIAVFSFYSLNTIVMLLPALILMDLGMLAYSIFKGWFKTKLDVYSYFIQPENWTKISLFRQEIKKNRTKSDQEVANDFTGELLFQEISNPVLKCIGNPVLNYYWKIIKPLIKW